MRRLVRLSFDPPARSDDDSDPPDPADCPTATEIIDAAAAAFGRIAVTRPDGRESRSKRHGAQPTAEQHVRDYLDHQLGDSAAAIAARRGVHRSTAGRSIARGRALVVDRNNPDKRDGGPNRPRN